MAVVKRSQPVISSRLHCPKYEKEIMKNVFDYYGITHLDLSLFLDSKKTTTLRNGETLFCQNLRIMWSEPDGSPQENQTNQHLNCTPKYTCE